MIRAAIYVRVSKGDGTQDPEYQLRELREFAKSRSDFRIVREYVDHVTGDIGKRRKRRDGTVPQFNEMMGAVENQEIDCVLVWKYDRICRSLITFLGILQTFDKHKVSFISTTQQLDTTTPHGKLFLHLLASFAEFERGVISERTKAGLRLARERGKRLGAKCEMPQATIDWMVERYLNGFRMEDIAVQVGMTRMGVLCLLRRQVCRLECEHGKYRCKVCHGKTAVRVPSWAIENALG